MSKLSENEMLTQITEKRERWESKNREERIKLEAKRDGYEEAISDVRGIIITKELEKQKSEKEIDELYNAYVKEMKNSEKYIDVINLMAKTFIEEIDVDKYYKKYDNMTVIDLVEYFVKKVEDNQINNK